MICNDPLPHDPHTVTISYGPYKVPLQVTGAGAFCEGRTAPAQVPDASLSGVGAGGDRLLLGSSPAIPRTASTPAPPLGVSPSDAPNAADGLATSAASSPGLLLPGVTADVTAGAAGAPAVTVLAAGDKLILVFGRDFEQEMAEQARAHLMGRLPELADVILVGGVSQIAVVKA